MNASMATAFPVDAASLVPVTVITRVSQGINPLQVVKPAPGTLAQITITTAGTSSISIYDNATAASGTVQFTTPATTSVGTSYMISMPAANGITVAAQTATTPAFTVSYS